MASRTLRPWRRRSWKTSRRALGTVCGTTWTWWRTLRPDTATAGTVGSHRNHTGLADRTIRGQESIGLRWHQQSSVGLTLTRSFFFLLFNSFSFSTTSFSLLLFLHPLNLKIFSLTLNSHLHLFLLLKLNLISTAGDFFQTQRPAIVLHQFSSFPIQFLNPALNFRPWGRLGRARRYRHFLGCSAVRSVKIGRVASDHVFLRGFQMPIRWTRIKTRTGIWISRIWISTPIWRAWNSLPRSFSPRAWHTSSSFEPLNSSTAGEIVLTLCLPPFLDFDSQFFLSIFNALLASHTFLASRLPVRQVNSFQLQIRSTFFFFLFTIRPIFIFTFCFWFLIFSLRKIILTLRIQHKLFSKFYSRIGSIFATSSLSPSRTQGLRVSLLWGASRPRRLGRSLLWGSTSRNFWSRTSLREDRTRRRCPWSFSPFLAADTIRSRSTSSSLLCWGGWRSLIAIV